MSNTYDWKLEEYDDLEDADENPMSSDGSSIVQQDSILSGLPKEMLEKLNPAKLRAINLYLTGSYTYKQIGAVIGVYGGTVGAWFRLPEVQAVVTELQNRELVMAQAQLNTLRSKAIDTMNDLLDSNMDNVRFQAAKDILDRGGLRAAQNIKVDKTVTNLEQQMAQLAEFTIDEDDVVDIDFEDMINEVKSSGD